MTTGRSLAALAAALGLLGCTPRPAHAQAVPDRCLALYSASVCTGWVMGAAVCQNRNTSYADTRFTTQAAVLMLNRMGIGTAYIGTAAAEQAGLEFIRSFCP